MKDKSKKPLTQAAIAAALGLTQQRISQLAKQGMPTTSVDAADKWRAANLDQWLIGWRQYYRKQGVRY